MSAVKLSCLLLITVMVSCKAEPENDPIGNALSGPVGLAVGCPGAPPAGPTPCAGETEYLYITNANRELKYRAGSVVAIDLSALDLTTGSHAVDDVAASSAEVTNFSGPLTLATANIDGVATDVAVVTNRYSEQRGRSSPDHVFFVRADPVGAGLEWLDLDPGIEGNNGLTVGEDPYGMLFDEPADRLYVANATSADISVLSLQTACSLSDGSTEAAPCLVDAVGQPAATDAVLTPADLGDPSTVVLGDYFLAQTATPTDNWTAVYVTDAGQSCSGASGFWRVTGVRAGPQSSRACTGEGYVTDRGEVIFTIAHPADVTAVGPVAGDSFAFSTSAGDFLDRSPISLSVSISGERLISNGVTGLVKDPVSGRLFTVARRSPYVAVVDPVLGHIEAMVPVGTGDRSSDYGRAIAISADGARLFVSYRAPDALLTLSPAEITSLVGPDVVGNVLVDALALDDRPGEFVLTSDESHALITSAANGVVSVLNLASASVVGRTPVGKGAFTIVLSSDGTLAFVANYLDDSISVIDADPTSPTFGRRLTEIVN